MGKHSRGRASVRAHRRLDPPDPNTTRRSGGMVERSPHLRIHSERRASAIKRTLVIVLALALLVIGGGAAYVYLQLAAAGRIMEDNSLQPVDMGNTLTERKADQPFTMVLLGADYRKGETEARADTIIVARIDPETRRVWLLSIPRDTRVEIPGYGVDKINAAHFYGGPKLVVETVTAFTGIPINHYAEIDFTGFRKMVDALGGVWVDVDVLIDDDKADSGTANKVTRIEPGYQLLNGEAALTYVRSRDFPDADFTRMKHQQTFFKALADQATKLDSVLKVPGMVKDVAQYIKTDLSMRELIDIALALRSMGASGIDTATLTGEWRTPYVWTDEERMDVLVGAMLAGRSFDGTATVDTEVPRSTISVTIRNGAGIEGCASATSDILSGLGYAVAGVGNANQFVYEETLVVYKSDRAAAVQISSELPKAKVVESRGMYEFDTDILVVVGKDYLTWNEDSTATP